MGIRENETNEPRVVVNLTEARNARKEEFEAKHGFPEPDDPKVINARLRLLSIHRPERFDGFVPLNDLTHGPVENYDDLMQACAEAEELFGAEPVSLLIWTIELKTS